jgi:3-hydroxyisobutyrate dehydrogenase-like beta-hydroxyacid dehydrogenase
MGSRLSSHLLKAGYEVHVYDKVPEKVQALAAKGARAGTSTADLAGKCDVLFSMIWDDEDLKEVVLGPRGVLAGAHPRLRYVDMSTVSPRFSREVAAQLASRDLPYLRAPVSGSPPVAEAGKLTVYASGPRELFDHCHDMFRTFSEKANYVGSAEEGRVAKLSINLIVQLSTAVLGEVLAFGSRAGVDRSLLMDAINDSIVGCPHYKVRAEAFKKRDLTYTVRWASPKDLELALSLASEVGAIMPLASLLQQYVRMITNRPVPQNGFTALSTLMEDINPENDGPRWA